MGRPKALSLLIRVSFGVDAVRIIVPEKGIRLTDLKPRRLQRTAERTR
jgi:hypothetical protein